MPHDLERVLNNCRLEVESEPEIGSKFRGIVEDALLSGDKNLDLALASFLKEWTPRGKPDLGDLSCIGATLHTMMSLEDRHTKPAPRERVFYCL